jgi:monofunctional biosynthetic peptidoglycan transglycosylase
MKRLILSGFISLAILSGLGISYYFYLKNDAKIKLLSSHYPVFDKEKNDYVLSPVKPHHWVRQDQISYEAKWAIVVSEDWAFFEHEGVDLRQLKIVLEESLQEGEFTRGASTITQQVIKNVILSPERTLTRKLKEILLTRELENTLSKEKILEIYLNIVELGKDIYGIYEASYYYFNKHPRNLNAREGAFLAMLLPSPIKYSVSFKEKRLTDFASEQIDSILIKLRQAKVLTEQQRQAELKKRFFWEMNADTQFESSGYDAYLKENF